MANEGTASIKVVGDVRDFARQTERDLNRALARVKPDPVNVPVDEEQMRRDGETAGETLAEGITRGADGRLRDARGKFIKAGETVGEQLGEGITRGADGRLRDSRGKFVKMGEGLGDGAGEGVKRGFGKHLSGFLGGLVGALGKAGSLIGKALSGGAGALASTAGALGTTVGVGFIAAAAAVIGPALAGTVAAAITSGLGLGLGAGLIGLGAVFLRESKPLKDALKGLGETLDDVGRRAAKPLLQPLIKSIGSFRELIRQLRPEFTSIFKGLAPVIKPLTQAFGEFLGAITRGIKDSLPGITAAFEGLSRALPVVGQLIGDFFRTIFANEDLIDNTTEGLLKLVAGPLTLLGPLISGLNVIFGVFNNLIPISSMAIDTMLGALTRFVDGGTGMLGRISEAWGPLGEAIQLVWDKLKLFAAEDDVGKLGARFQEVVEAIKAAWGPLREFLGVVWDEALAAVQRLWEEEFIPWWNETGGPLLQEAVENAFSIAWDAAVAVTGGALSGIVDTVRLGTLRLVAVMEESLVPLPENVEVAFQNAHSTIASAVSSMVSTARTGFQRLVAQARDTLRGIRNAVTGAFSGAAGWLRSAGADIINGLISGIQAGFGRVRGLLGELTAMLPDWKGPADVDRRILRESGRLVMRGFEAGLMDQSRSVRNTLMGLTAGLPAMATTGVGSASGGGASLAGATFNIYMSGAADRDAGTAAAEAVLARLAQAGLVRG